MKIRDSSNDFFLGGTISILIPVGGYCPPPASPQLRAWIEIGLSFFDRELGLIPLNDPVFVYNTWKASVCGYNATRRYIVFTVNHSRYILCMLVARENYVVKTILLTDVYDLEK